MKLLLDEMYAGLKEYFETLGWQALTVQDVGLQGGKGQGHRRVCEEEQLTARDPRSEAADLAGLKGVRYVRISNAMIAKIADAKIREKYQDPKI